MKTLFFAGVAAAAFAFVSPAMAAGPSGNIGGGYNSTSSSGGSGHLNDWNVNGSINVPFGSTHLSGQLDGDYNAFHLSGGGNLHSSQVDGAVMWNDPRGRVGLTVGQTTFGIFGSSIHVNNYGLFGVYYPSDRWTVGLKGGQLRQSSFHANDYGEEVIGYVNPNLAVSVTGDQLTGSGSHINSWGLGGEFQPTARPWTVAANYGYTGFSGGGGHLNTIGIKLKWYFGGGATSTLVQNHREGAETFGTRQSAINYFY